MSASIATPSKARGLGTTRLFSQRPQVGANAWADKMKTWMKTFAKPAKQTEMTGLVFQPFSEVQPELSTVGKTPATSSFARVEFNEECEAAINEQINIEYTISYVYHALHAFFDRDNVGLPGFASFFNEASKEEREHAQLLMQYQNKRGGRVQLKVLLNSQCLALLVVLAVVCKPSFCRPTLETEFLGPKHVFALWLAADRNRSTELQAVAMPEMEFANDDKGEALYAMELALSLEKLNFQKLRALHAVADKHSDAALCDFIEGDLLQEQVRHSCLWRSVCERGAICVCDLL